MSQEIAIGLEWLVSTLAGDSTLQSVAPGGVWRGVAPVGTPPPFVIIALQAGSDVTTMNLVRLMSNITYQVKGVGPSSGSTTLAGIADRIDLLLHHQQAQLTDGLILSSARQAPLLLDEVVDGEMWSNFGGTYNLLIQRIP